MSYEDHKKALASGGIKCSELVDILGKMGFSVRDCGSAGHKVYKHPAIREFSGSNLNCGHRQTAQVKPVYIKRVLKIVEMYELEIREFLGESK